MQMSDVLRMASGQVDSLHVAELETQLHEARSEIQVLNTKLNKMKSSGVSKSQLVLAPILYNKSLFRCYGAIYHLVRVIHG